MMHLKARVPNEGARRLAWHLGEAVGADGEAARIEAALDARPGNVERMVAGEIVPGGEMGFAITRLTDYAVTCGDWWRAAEGGWFERPRARIVRRGAERAARRPGEQLAA